MPEFGICSKWTIDRGELGFIPASGPAVVVTSRPVVPAEESVLVELLSGTRKDIRFLRHAAGWPHAVEALRAQGLVVADVSTDLAARLALETKAPVIPVNLDGVSRIPDPLVRAIHPRLRAFTAATERRYINVKLLIGKPITKRTLEGLSAAATTHYLRWRTGLLREPESQARPIESAKPLAFSESSPGDWVREIEALPPAAEVSRLNDTGVYLASAAEIPRILREIGRLREISFRAAGEGTGQPLDLDQFDNTYQHLFLWNHSTREIAGAYRLALTTRILRTQGIAGLYTSTLFEIAPQFFANLGPALELGRSFIRPEYQKSYAPLLLLWKAIGEVIRRNPEAAHIIGPVSISDRYHPRSRRLLVEFYRTRDGAEPLRRYVKPRHPVWSAPWQVWDDRAASALLRGLDDLAGPIAELESDGKSIPVLLRHYDRLGAKLLAFNVDSDFSNALDGLAVLDLDRADPVLLERYIGSDAVSIRRTHRNHAA